MHEIRSTIHRHLPWLGLRLRALLDALLLSGGSVGSAEDVAARLGLGHALSVGQDAPREWSSASSPLGGMDGCAKLGEETGAGRGAFIVLRTPRGHGAGCGLSTCATNDRAPLVRSADRWVRVAAVPVRGRMWRGCDGPKTEAAGKNPRRLVQPFQHLSLSYTSARPRPWPEQPLQCPRRRRSRTDDQQAGRCVCRPRCNPDQPSR
jgi:hypothetical protein